MIPRVVSNKSRGIVLIECLIVVVVLAILATILIPRLSVEKSTQLLYMVVVVGGLTVLAVLATIWRRQDLNHLIVCLIMIPVFAILGLILIPLLGAYLNL